MGITAIFESPESYLAYAVDPAHLAIVERLIEPRASRRTATQIGMAAGDGDVSDQHSLDPPVDRKPWTPAHKVGRLVLPLNYRPRRRKRRPVISRSSC